MRRAQREAEVQEAGERNIVEAKFGESKRFYGLDRILEKTGATTEVMICVTFIAINSFRILRRRLAFFCRYLDRYYMQFSFGMCMGISNHWIISSTHIYI